VRTRVSEIRELGRATQGVTLIALDGGSQLSGLQRIVENDANSDAGEAASTDPAGEAPGTPASNDPPGDPGTETN
jgi:DNA gyrase subunit A